MTRFYFDKFLNWVKRFFSYYRSWNVQLSAYLIKSKQSKQKKDQIIVRANLQASFGAECP